MKYLEEYRDPKMAQQIANSIKAITTKSWTIMEICGGQTHAIIKYGIDELLPDEITLVHGPGCPVCVTPMLRVPGSERDLFTVKANGADVRIVYSPIGFSEDCSE